MKCIKDYLNSLLRENANNFILHMETNDLNSELSPELTAKLIADVTLTKNENHDVITNIIVHIGN